MKLQLQYYQFPWTCFVAIFQFSSPGSGSRRKNNSDPCGSTADPRELCCGGGVFSAVHLPVRGCEQVLTGGDRLPPTCHCLHGEQHHHRTRIWRQKRRQRSSLLFRGQIPCHASVLLWDDLKKRINCTMMIWKKDELKILKIVLVQIASAARNLINSVPQIAATTLTFSSVFIPLLWF